MNTQTFDVTGLTCEHCASAVRSEISALGTVSDVAVDLHPGAVSQVTVTGEVTTEQIAAALDEAGDYHLA